MHWVKLTISWSPWPIAPAVLAAEVGREEQPAASSVRPSSAAASAPAAGRRRVGPVWFVVFMWRSLLRAGHAPACGLAKRSDDHTGVTHTTAQDAGRPAKWLVTALAM